MVTRLEYPTKQKDQITSDTKFQVHRNHLRVPRFAAHEWTCSHQYTPSRDRWIWPFPLLSNNSVNTSSLCEVRKLSGYLRTGYLVVPVTMYLRLFPRPVQFLATVPADMPLSQITLHTDPSRRPLASSLPPLGILPLLCAILPSLPFPSCQLAPPFSPPHHAYLL